MTDFCLSVYRKSLILIPRTVASPWSSMPMRRRTRSSTQFPMSNETCQICCSSEDRTAMTLRLVRPLTPTTNQPSCFWINKNINNTICASHCTTEQITQRRDDYDDDCDHKNSRAVHTDPPLHCGYHRDGRQAASNQQRENRCNYIRGIRIKREPEVYRGLRNCAASPMHIQ